METPIKTPVKKKKKVYPKFTEVICGRCGVKNYYTSYLRTNNSTCSGCNAPM